MKACETLRDELKAYADGELPLLARWAVRRHLAHCVSCREEITVMEQIGNELRAGDAGALDPALRAKILAGAPADVPYEPAPPPAALPLWRRNPFAVWGGAALLLLVWIVVNPGLQHSTPKASNLMVHGGLADTQKIDADRSNSLPVTIARAPAMTAPEAEQALKMSGEAVNARLRSGSSSFGGGGSGGKFGRAATPPAPERYVHKEADITVEVEKLEEQSDAVEKMVRDSGGFVANNHLSTGDDGLKSAALAVKVPVTLFDTILGRVAKLGEVKAKNVTGEDVTERMSDEKQAVRVLEEQIQTDRARQQARAAASESLTQLKVEAAQAQGRLDLLKKTAALANITVRLKERSHTVIKSGGFLDEMGDTGRAAVNSFMQAARLPVLLLIWLLAYAPIWVPLAIAYRYAARAQRRRVDAREAREWQAKWRPSTAGPETPAT